MNLSISDPRSWQSAFEAFQVARFQASLYRIGAALRGREGTLADFNHILPRLNPTRTYRGIEDILVAQISGSVGRARDFDARFRPLKGHLIERWMGVYLRWAQTGSWPLIQVIRVGEQYFVEDGHHRVSVAHAIGMAYIQAEVWEVTPRSFPTPAARPMELCTTKVCPGLLRKAL